MIRIARTTTPVTPLARRVISAVVVLALWLFAFGSLATLGLLPTDAIRLASTAFAAIAGIVAIALLTSHEPNGKPA